MVVFLLILRVFAESPTGSLEALSAVLEANVRDQFRITPLNGGHDHALSSAILQLLDEREQIIKGKADGIRRSTSALRTYLGTTTSNSIASTSQRDHAHLTGRYRLILLKKIGLGFHGRNH